MTTLTINLPDSLVEEAKEAGLLDAKSIEIMLRETLRHRAVDGLFVAADKLASAGFPAMTLDEIQQEVSAVRNQRQLHAPGA